MTVEELRKLLGDYRSNIEIIAYDGMDPSDWCVVTELELRKGEDGKTYLAFYSMSGRNTNLKPRE